MYNNLRMIRKLEQKMEYKTEQRRIIYGFFEENKQRAFSARGVYEHVKSSGVSMSAIYRNIAAMVKEGTLRKTVEDKEATYQLVGCEHNCNKLHLTCVLCGKTEHVSPEAAARVRVSVDEADGFQLDSIKTVLYGTCRDCRIKAKE